MLKKLVIAAVFVVCVIGAAYAYLLFGALSVMM